jgi:DNA repair exonuclease SbcCD ATPase subunit
MSNLIQERVQTLETTKANLKEAKAALKEIESDVPMELEELMLALKDLKKQVKEKKAEHLSHLLDTNSEYGELREMIQQLKEDKANAQLSLFEAIDHHDGDLDQTVVVDGSPVRLQTQREKKIYLNGKAVK